MNPTLTTPKVTVIPAIKHQKAVSMQQAKDMKRRVVIYARVSTEAEAQHTSIEMQEKVLVKKVQENPLWALAGVYIDDGISGTTTKKRPAFTRMMDDARAGKFDIILVKSISRFGRNSEIASLLRELRDEYNVTVFFDENGIDTADKNNDFSIEIQALIAQEESRSISNNVGWGIHKRMSEGQVTMPYKSFLGYEKGPDGKPQIVEEEAEIVRLIYQLCLEGHSVKAISDKLTALGIRSPRGKANWSPTTVRSILTNEKYKGDSLRQKTYTSNHIDKRIKKNDGRYEQYYIRDSHPGIIPKDTFELVQTILSKKRPNRIRTAEDNPFANRIICGKCGKPFCHKVWRRKPNITYDMWVCRSRYNNKDGIDKCPVPNIRQSAIEQGYIEATCQLYRGKSEYRAIYEQKLAELSSPALEKAETKQLADLNNQIIELKKELRTHTDNGVTSLDDYDFYDLKRNLIIDKIKACQAQLDTKKNHLQILSARQERLRILLDILKNLDHEPDSFDLSMWRNSITEVRIKQRVLTYVFCDEIEISIRRTDK